MKNLIWQKIKQIRMHDDKNFIYKLSFNMVYLFWVYFMNKNIKSSPCLDEQSSLYLNARLIHG